ncbi:MAG: hypothetical protein NZZ60_04255 [Bacteroidia bacterium]|nr:hypothetical protein [Bacteroidia bacterium]MCX7651487.1 hypothetical protein [Bacteroidia bacterium]MDW8416758.1 hypothetical protein [Bacteroidia bacterium]
MRFGPVRLLTLGSRWHGRSVYLHLDEKGIQGIELSDAPPLAEISVGWVDLLAWTRQPEMPSSESLHSLAERARKGGFTHVLVGGWGGWHEPAVLAKLYSDAVGLPVWMHFLAAWATPEGNLAPLESLRAEGAAGWSIPPYQPIPWRTLIQALPYLRYLGGPVFLLPFWEAAQGEIGVSETLSLALSGWRGTPVFAETVAIHAIAALHRALGSMMCIGPLSSKEGQEVAQFYGLQTFTSISYLVAHAEKLLSYNPFWKLHPPLRSAADQRYLGQAVLSREMLVASGDILPPAEEKNIEWSAAAIGQPTVHVFASLLWETGGTLSSEGWAPEKLIQLLAENPRRFLGISPFGLEVGAPLDFTVFRIEDRAEPLSAPWSEYTSALRVLGTIRCLADAHSLQSQMS